MPRGGAFLDDQSFIPGIYVEYEYWAEMDQTVSLIRNAGGLAMVAHYSSARHKVPPDLLEKFIQEKRIDGIETVYGLWGLGTEEGNKWNEDRKHLKQLLEKYNILNGGGADIHKPEDFQLLANTLDYAKETENMAEEIIKKSRVDTHWSNF